MDIPYGFDCYAFQRDEIKYFESNLYRVRHSEVHPMMARLRAKGNKMTKMTSQRPISLLEQVNSTNSNAVNDFVKFTRKNEDYPKEQIMALGSANRLNMSEIDKRIFCGIKIQIGIGVVTNFLRRGLQYKSPIKGRSELINGSWTGIMKGLTTNDDSPSSYDLAFGNFLAWDEEFPYIKFGPFFAIESKLVMLTGSSRRIEASSFGTNIAGPIWLSILSLLLILSLLSSSRLHWRRTKPELAEAAPRELAGGEQEQEVQQQAREESESTGMDVVGERTSIWRLLSDFLFIYFTMLLNKPSFELDELIWPKYGSRRHPGGDASGRQRHGIERKRDEPGRGPRTKRASELPTSIRMLSYTWSAACLVMASIYSGEMLAVMLLHADQNIDTIAQLINAKPPIEPVIRQDDFTYSLMLKSLDENMLKLHNKTRIIQRSEVYSRQFIESVSARKQALLGDDELIETIYDIYHKYYPLYKSKMTYLQYPISIMYRKDLNATLERDLRRGMVQMFEMGLIHRWYQAQKDTYIQFYDTYERKTMDDKKSTAGDMSTAGSVEQKYKPLSMQHFNSFFKAMLYCQLVALLVLVLELLTYRFSSSGATCNNI